MSSSKSDGSLTICMRQAAARSLCWIALVALGATGLATSVTAASFDEMLPATPLVLKDGRIAEVLVHAIPFPDDAVAPSSSIRNQLDSFTQGIATDCFLTAQVIGHVDKSEISGRETADIHRLARARADTIQSSLIGNGLPAASIASVWDWRFMVQQARVTLWVFRLTAGEDCDDTPLGHQDEQRVAEASPEDEVPVAAKAPESGEVTTAALPKEATPAAVQHHVIPAAKPKTGELAAALSARSSPRKEATQATSGSAGGSVETKLAALSSAEESVDKTGSTQLVDKGALEIVFATNSSYFPEGAGDQLRAFIKTLDKDKSYVLRIQTSVDGTAGVNGAASTDDAKRYNAWLAERRFKRVEAWLLKNSDGRTLTLEPSMVENDGSRRVRIEPNPLG
jgi:outer membrane protein OmpA-like peptidoglycan-associated protein